MEGVSVDGCLGGESCLCGGGVGVWVCGLGREVCVGVCGVVEKEVAAREEAIQRGG